ncbi:methylmalonyl-CoA mutase small subunit [Dysgonomonas macrotermitis]|uniref:Methylmalonyl-CoA mutase small subunit n=1 Tax=Dysgonomonas macrotermitis TaxID=1346286 RepID=A0A1M5E340_9BACT|nr:methylmalonyl-CoA mutase small subunit [Dysgonomonas macrotermitis]SHF73647.1 heterodimeric methylmalonyl-CoA mutase small subunit [Dysgonomonas macrotermitis]
MANQKEKLFTDFPAISTEEWMAKITADLKGADFEKKLVWKTNEGFKVNPFYRSENIEGLKTIDALPGEFPYVRGTKKDNDWYVRQDITVVDFKAANAKALDILNKGITSLGFIIKGDDVSAENIKTLLKDICPEAVELNFSTCHRRSLDLVKILVDDLKSKNADVLKCFGSVNYDPFKTILKKGVDNAEWVKQASEIVLASAALPRFRVLNVNANKLNNAGAYIYQELGFALANGNEILSKLVEAGLDATLVAKKIKFNFGIGSNYFMEIAKFRAARWLWAEIVNAYNPKCNNDCPSKEEDGICRCASKIYAHAETSTYNMTTFDAHVNLLRTQTEAMSAGIAGVNSLTVLPFDESFKDSDNFSERIARNQQLLLKEECHFDKITDPSAGSYYIENLTSSIADEAWKLFLEIDEAGFYAALKAGTVQTAVKTSSDARFKALATRREVLLGTNQYPNFTEVAAGKITRGGCSCGCSTEKGNLQPLLSTRLATDFEELRLATEKSGKTPVAFMLTIGSLAMRLARSQFSCNFLACAGYKVIDNLGFETVEAGVKAAREKNADIIVICSSDDEYTTLAPAAYELVKGGKEIFVVAGAPASTDDLKAIGIQNFINVKSNVLETLKGFNTALGIN